MFPLMGLASLIWFLVRVTPKPSRAHYPCMKVAAPIASSFVVYMTGLTATQLSKNTKWLRLTLTIQTQGISIMNSSLRILLVVISVLAIPVLLCAQWTPTSARNGAIERHSDGPTTTAAVSYDIATWEGFRTAAVSYTFDDNCPNQLAIAVPMFDQFGFKLTLFTVTSSSWGWKANWSALQAAAEEGHEIASHTIDHQSLGGLSDAQQQTELELSRDTINARISGHSCITFAYPNCITGNSTLVSQFYIAARGCSGQIVSTTPGDFMNVSSFVCGNQGLNTAIDMESRANNALASKGWCVYLMHGINGTEPGAYSPISQDTIQATLQYFSLHQDQFWVAPFGTVARYIQERNSVSVSEISANADSITAHIVDLVNNIYPRVPLTIRRPLPEGWDSVVVRQGGVIVSSKRVKVDTVSYVVFNAVPNAATLTIINKTGVRVGVRNESSSAKTFSLFQNYPNPFNPSTAISYRLPAVSHVTLRVYDLLGREVATLVDEYQVAGQHSADFHAVDLPGGMYLCRLRAGRFAATGKLLLVK
jgi:hypothetical protein